MDFEFTPEEKDFQKEVREFMDREVNEGVIAETESLQGAGPYSKELIRKLGSRRMLTPSWPEEYGGRGLTVMADSIFMYELTYHRGPFPLDGVEIARCLLHMGPEHLKKRFLLPVARGEIDVALGYTEPDAGSDLASVKLRAVEDGDEYILNGQKIYNTEAHHCEYHWILVRTDPDAPKHKGLSIFIVDLNSPGITIRPLYTSSGLRTNEVFYEDVRVPKENMVSEKNGGWSFAQNALRGGAGAPDGALRQRFDSWHEYLLGPGRDIWQKNPWVTDEMANYYIALHVHDLLAFRQSAMVDNGMPVTYEGPMIPAIGGPLRKAFFHAVMRMMGPYGQLAEGSKWVPLEGAMSRDFLDSCRQTVIHGANEVQKILVARALGLSRK